MRAYGGMSMRSAAFLLIVVSFSSGASSGCAGSVRATFHPIDETFRPSPGPAPRVYVEGNIADVPKVGLRSVGLIEVTVPQSSGIDRAIAVAIDKGRELGCWILIEHSAFATVSSSAELDHGARMILAHGAGPTPQGGGPKRKLVTEFDCVIQTAVAPIIAEAPERP